MAILLAGASGRLEAAEPLQGAAKILESLAAAPAQPETKPISPGEQFRQSLTNFSTRAVTLAPAEAAVQWLGLVDELEKLDLTGRRPSGLEDQPPPNFGDVMQVIPPPTAWAELDKAIGKRPAPASLKDVREFGLRMLGSALTGNRERLAGLSSDFQALLAKAPKEESMQVLHFYRALDTAMLALSDDPKAILSGVERQLTAAERGRETGYSSIQIPDLVSIVGEADATPYIRRALLSKARQVSFEGKATVTLARTLALSLVNDMVAPRWELVDSLETVELYEAMDKKFNEAKAPQPANPADALANMEHDRFGNDYSLQRAKVYYLMGLIVRGRTDDAIKFANALRDDGDQMQFETAAVDALGRAGFIAALDEFLFTLLSQNPELPYWESYISTAAKAGKTDRMLKLARDTAASPNLDAEKKGNIRENLYRALLAADRVEEGVQELKTLLASSTKPDAPRRPRINSYARQSVDWQSHALALARIGHQLKRTDWFNEGIQAATPKAGSDPAEADDFMAGYRLKGLIHILVQEGRLAEAETILANNLQEVSRRKPSANPYGSTAPAAREPLAALLGLYHRAGLHNDVRLLLEQSPHWGARDLADLLKADDSGFGFDLIQFATGKSTAGNPLGIAAARALADAGRKPEALAIVNTLLDTAPGDDRAYELLIELAGNDAIPRLDALFARDQFEERPLIWKALLLHRAGKNDDAEKVARQAIAIDPSDGEQGKGDRMRVYSVLADIRLAQGNQTEADILRGAIKAIRLSEEADDFMTAGLISRGVKMYQESLKFFADAYCIQSRLAVQLTELGQHEVAALHYEKAFELMPDSFGRVESHCFGCESTFSGPQAQDVAERVFTALAAKNPDKPQIHYLFGYLRSQQGRGKDALPHFRRATELDPDYLNAWSKIAEIGRELRLPAAEKDRVAFNIIRLDPLSRHSSANLGSVSDLGQLWDSVAKAAAFRVSPPAKLLALPASARAVEEQERESKGSALGQRFVHRTYSYRSRGGTTPGMALAQHELIAAIAGLIAGNSIHGY